MTLEDVANQLLVYILGNANPCDTQLSAKEDAVEAELRKGLSGGNTKLSNWIEAFSKASTAAFRAAFITFWLCKFVLYLRPHYALKPV